MAEKLDPEAKRLRNISPGDLADAIGALEARVEVLKAEAIRRELRRAEGEAYRIVLTPPGTQQRTDKPLLLRVLGKAEPIRRELRRAEGVRYTGWRDKVSTAGTRRSPACLPASAGGTAPSFAPIKSSR